MRDPDLVGLRRLHPLTIALGLARTMKSFAFIIVLAAFFAPAEERVERTVSILGLLAIYLLISGAVATLGWWIVRYGIVRRRLVLHTGLISRNTKTVPVDRIQDLQLKQDLLPRLMGLVEVVVETAGSSEAEVTLAYVSRTEAEALRTAILAERGAPIAAERPAPTVLRRATVPEILLAGATETRIGFIVAAAFGIYQLAGEVGERALAPIHTFVDHTFSAAEQTGLLVAAVVGILLLVLGWLASIGTALVRLHGFRLERDGGVLRRSHGLLTRWETALPLRRIQSLALDQNLVRRWLGRGVLRAGTAGSAKDQATGGAPVLFPLVRTGEAGAIFHAVLDDLDLDAVTLVPAPAESLRREWLETAVRLLIVTLVLALAFGPIALWLLALAPIQAYRAWNRWRALGHAVTAHHVFARSGVLRRVLCAVPLEKIQSVHLERSPWQRVFGLADLTVTTAAPGRLRSAGLRDLDVEHAAHLYRDLRHAAARGGRRSPV